MSSLVARNMKVTNLNFGARILLLLLVIAIAVSASSKSKTKGKKKEVDRSNEDLDKVKNGDGDGPKGDKASKPPSDKGKKKKQKEGKKGRKEEKPIQMISTFGDVVADNGYGDDNDQIIFKPLKEKADSKTAPLKSTKKKVKPVQDKLSLKG